MDKKIGKEVKIGLAVIGVLITSFGYVLVRRLAHEGQLASAAQAQEHVDGVDKPSNKSNSQKPSILAGLDSGQPAELTPEQKASSGSLANARRHQVDGDPNDPSNNARDPFMPRDQKNADDHATDDHAADHHDRHAAPAGYGQPAFGNDAGNGSGNNGSSGPSLGSNSNNGPGENAGDGAAAFGKPSSRQDASGGHGDGPAILSGGTPAGADAGGSADPFKQHSATPAAATDNGGTQNGTAQFGSPPTPPADISDRNASAKANPWGAPKPIAKDDHGTGGPAFGTADDSARQDHRHDGARLNGINTDPAAIAASQQQPTPLQPLAPANNAGGNMAVSGTPIGGAPTGSAAGSIPADTIVASPAPNPGAIPMNPSRDPFGQANAPRYGAPTADPARITSPPAVAYSAPLGGNYSASPTTNYSAPPAVSYSSPPASPGVDPAAPQQLGIDGSARKGEYMVQPNDNFWTISEKVYGTGGYFKAIFEYNRSRHPQADRLQVGESIETPDAAVLQKSYPDLCPKPGRGIASSRVVPASARVQPGTRVYTVEEGDTLFEIARRELGKPARWGEIYALNRDALGNDFDYLKPGTQLLIPSDGAHGASVARDPSNTFSR